MDEIVEGGAQIKWSDIAGQDVSALQLSSPSTALNPDTYVLRDVPF